MEQADVESAFASPPGSVDGHPPTSPPRGVDEGSPAALADPPSPVVVLDAKHVVADGDTLGLIGEMYQTPVRVIQRLNDLHPDSIIYPGETLRVPTQLRAETHVVVPGETLVVIAKRFDAPVDHVKALNGLSGDAVIHPGNELRVLRGGNAAIARRQRERERDENEHRTNEMDERVVDHTGEEDRGRGDADGDADGIDPDADAGTRTRRRTRRRPPRRTRRREFRRSTPEAAVVGGGLDPRARPERHRGRDPARRLRTHPSDGLAAHSPPLERGELGGARGFAERPRDARSGASRRGPARASLRSPRGTACASASSSARTASRATRWTSARRCACGG
jgi:LysM repeat protein